MKIALLGAGVEGKALAKYFSDKGKDVTLCDRTFVEGPFPKGVKTRFGNNYMKDLEGFDLVFRSPGISILHPELERLRKKGKPPTSLTKYFFEKCPCIIVGVTGTNGKGTTSTLIYEMLKQGGKTVYLGGNIGVPAIEFLDVLEKEDVVVLELSSFQLQDLEKSPVVAIVLPITPDHLDYHKNLEEYIEAKKNIVRYQTAGSTIIVCDENVLSAGFADDAVGKVLHVNEDSKERLLGSQKSRIKPRLRGAHNVINITAAALCAESFGVGVEIIRRVAESFEGLPHRLQFVEEKNEVLFFNDSCSTTPETCSAAIKAFDKPIILIAGGSDKGADYTLLGEELIKRLNVKAVVLMGETKKKIESALDKANDKLIRKATATGKSSEVLRRKEVPLEIITANGYQEAFMVAKLMAEPGDVVLLSPASASLDEFKNYKERGEMFMNFVRST